MVEPVTSAFAASVVASVLASGAYDAIKVGVKKAVEIVAKRHPEIIDSYNDAKGRGDHAAASSATENFINTMILEADNGQLEVSGVILEALKGVRFDHKNGKVNISNTKVNASEVFTGGGSGATGSTTIDGETTIQSAGTKMTLTGGAKITMTGGASIRQN